MFYTPSLFYLAPLSRYGNILELDRFPICHENVRWISIQKSQRCYPAQLSMHGVPDLIGRGIFGAVKNEVKVDLRSLLST